MYKETFPQKLKQARTNIGYTQNQVAKLLQISQSVISKYESGTQEPDIENLGLLADLYQESLDWLIGTKGKNKEGVN